MRNNVEALASIALVLSVLFACSSSGSATSSSEKYRYFDIVYDAELVQVERPEDAAERYGEYEVVERDTSQGHKYVYRDDLLTAGFVMTGKSIVMVLTNKTDFSITVPLEQASFVGPSGSSDRILTGEMSYMERNESPPPIVTPPGASSSVVLIPSDNVSREAVAPIFTPTIIRRDTSVYPDKQKEYKTSLDKVRKNIDKNFSIFLPIEIQGTVNEYNFTFSVEDFSKRENPDPSFGEKAQAIGAGTNL